MDFFSVIICICTAFPYIFGYYIGFKEWNLISPLMLASLVSFVISLKLIPSMKKKTKAAGLFGQDLNKHSSKEM